MGTGKRGKAGVMCVCDDVALLHCHAPHPGPPPTYPTTLPLTPPFMAGCSSHSHTCAHRAMQRGICMDMCLHAAHRRHLLRATHVQPPCGPHHVRLPHPCMRCTHPLLLRSSQPASSCLACKCPSAWRLHRSLTWQMRCSARGFALWHMVGNRSLAARHALMHAFCMVTA